MEYYNSVKGGSGIFADFDIWYELHRLDFWSWVAVAVVLFFVIIFPAIKERKK